MSEVIQVGLYNADTGSLEELHNQICNLNFVRFVGHVDTESELLALTSEAKLELVFFNLDPEPQNVIEVIEQYASRFPEVALIALSAQTSPEAILAPMRAGCDQFVCTPIDPEDLARAVSRVASKRLLTQGKSRRTCVVGASGGVGATSIASNLALEIGLSSQHPCAIVDLDLQFGDVAANFDSEAKYTLYDIASSTDNIDKTVLESVLTEAAENVLVLARPYAVDQADSVTPQNIHHTIDILSSIYENVVIDLPRKLSGHEFAALEQADCVLIVCQLLVPSIRNARRYLDAVIAHGIPEERIHIVLNRGDTNTGRVSKEDLEETIKRPVVAVIPNDFQFMAKALDFGQPGATTDRNNPVGLAIASLARFVVSGGQDVGTETAEKKSFLGRLLSR